MTIFYGLLRKTNNISSNDNVCKLWPFGALPNNSLTAQHFKLKTFKAILVSIFTHEEKQMAVPASNADSILNFKPQIKLNFQQDAARATIFQTIALREVWAKSYSKPISPNSLTTKMIGLIKLIKRRRQTT
ncbi:MAG: hypothetical protein KME19_04455 [Microcoleus vaginatus WJT46-NPBG5]|nr:hypothetical protein [Microcoleus vaginatus WJT46-NPBG5]